MIKLLFILLFAVFCMVGVVTFTQSMCDNYMK